MSEKLNPQTVGNIGLYDCCYRLSLRGWNVMPTARNARGIDVVAYSADGSRYLGLQIKALSRRDPVPLGSDLEKCAGDFWLIVNRVVTEPAVFILSPSEVRAFAHRNTKGDKVSYWLQPKEYMQEQFKDAWDRLDG